MVHTKMAKKDPGYEAARATERKAEKHDVYPTKKVPPSKTREKLLNKRI
jgi:hypothetical protein